MDQYDDNDGITYEDIQSYALCLGGPLRGCYDKTISYRQSEKSLVNDFNSLNIPEEIKKEATRISLDRKARKDTRRKMLVFWCLFNAYNNLNDPQDPRILAKIVGIPVEHIQKAIKLFDKEKVIISVSPVRFVGNHLISMDKDPDMPEEYKNILRDHHNKIVDIANKICESGREVLENYPQVIASAIIQYYILKNKLNMDKVIYMTILSKLAERSKITINKIVKELNNLDI